MARRMISDLLQQQFQQIEPTMNVADRENPPAGRKLGRRGLFPGDFLKPTQW